MGRLAALMVWASRQDKHPDGCFPASTHALYTPRKPCGSMRDQEGHANLGKAQRAQQIIRMSEPCGRKELYVVAEAKGSSTAKSTTTDKEEGRERRQSAWETGSDGLPQLLWLVAEKEEQDMTERQPFVRARGVGDLGGTVCNGVSSGSNAAP